jgi:2-polyprenyl-3-methyl-5-hydroxy-6-metoxy-1,4-benzoquinol methylase
MSKKIQILNLGFHPYADTFIEKKYLQYSEPIYQLACELDKKNYLIQNKIKTSDFERYNLYDYSYTSSNSSFSKNYWRQYFLDINEYLKKNNKIKKNFKILEIGSNDGYLLSQFKKNKFSIMGIDASKKMCQIANKKKIKTLNLLFNYKTSQKIKKQYKTSNLIIANNVLNHSNDPEDFLKAAKNLMNKDAILIFEFPYWSNLIKDMKFDQIYHEHVSYFTVKYLKFFFKKIELSITHIQETDYHGGSLRIFVERKKNSLDDRIVQNYIKKEEKQGLFKKKTYEVFTNEIKKRKMILLKKIIKYKSLNYTVVGVGAAAKANTFINYMGFNNEIVDFVTDISKFKIGKWLPLSRIPIKHDKDLRKIKKLCVIILSWNLYKILKPKILKINKRAKLVSF